MPYDPATVKALFLEAAALGNMESRSAFLHQRCGSDAALLARVQSLLAANDRAMADEPTAAQEDLENQTSVQLEESHRAKLSLQTGELIAGKYKLIEAIGEGGMGSVYMAQQTEPVKRAVAVKVIKAGMDSKAVLARFDLEKQALAMMDHPNIATVLDAGMTADGRSFFVMELVKGVPITEFCDNRKLTPRQRLELFIPVCQAIQHAHQKGIIHRDIKPSNVLVALYDDRPVPKVIDFGVAKAVGTALTDRTPMTGFGALVGTPEYMSPEMASLNNMDIDTRSDVYALGVLLYELLTGHTPVDRKSLGQAAMLEILRIVREVDALSPSAKLSSIDTLASVAANRSIEPAKLSRLMKGELDWVLLKALEKDRARRYDSANELAGDLQRYLADEVVEARPPSTGYRLRKFVRRHRGQVLAASLLLLALIGGTVGTTLGLFEARRERDDANIARANKEKQRIEAEEQRDRANREAARATALNGFMEKMFLSVNPFANGTRGVTVLELVNRASEQADATLKDRPLEEAAVRTFLGDTFRALGKPNEAVKELERAVALRSTGSEAGTFAHSESLQALGRAYGSKNDYKSALAVNLKALDILTTFGDAHLKELCIQHLNIAEMRIQLSQFAEAEQSLHQGEELMGRLPSVPPELRGTHAGHKAHLAQSWKSDFEAAERWREEALRGMRESGTEIKVAIALADLATAKMLRDKLDEAVELYEEALIIDRRAYGEVHPSIAIVMENLANVRFRKKEHAKATDLLNQVAVMRDAIFGTGSFAGARTRFNVSLILVDQGEFQKARELLELVTPIFRQNVGDKSVEMASLARLRGNCMAGLKDHDGALTEYQAALTIFNAVGKPTLGVRLKTLLNIAEVQRAKGQLDQADDTRTQALSVFDPKSADHAKWSKLFEEAAKKNP